MAIDRILHKQTEQGKTQSELLKELAETYLPLGPSGDGDYPQYAGAEVEELDAPFTES